MSRARSRRKMPASLAVAVTSLLVVLSGIVPTSAHASPLVPSEPEPAQIESAQVGTDSITPTVLTPGANLSLSIRVTAAASEALLDGEVRIRLQRQRIGTRSGLKDWTNREDSEDAGATIGAVAVPEVAAGSSTTVTIEISAESIGLPTSANLAGPRGLGIELRSGGNRVAMERSFLPWNTTASAPKTSLTVLTPLTAPPADPATGLTTASNLGPATTSLPQSKGCLWDSVNQLAGPYFSWAVDPALLAAAEVGGTTTQEWLNRFQELAGDKTIIELPFSDPDLSAIGHANRQDILVAATSLGDTTTDLLPDTSPITDLAFPLDGAVDQVTANMASRIGSKSIVVSGDHLSPIRELAYTPTGRAEIQTSTGAIRAAISDATLDSVISGITERNAAASIQRILAETAVVSLERPNDSRAIMATIPRQWNPGSRAHAQLAAALETSPWLAPVSLQDLLETPAPDIARNPLATQTVGVGEATPKQLAAIIDSRESLRAFGRTIPDPDAIIGPLSRGWLTLASTSWRNSAVERSKAMATQTAATDDLTSSIFIELGSSITVVSDSSRIPIVVHNKLDQDASISVKLWSQPALMVSSGSALEVIPANSQRTIQVPIEVIASGDVTMTAALTTVEGTRFSEAQTVDARMHVNWETIGTIVIGGGLSILLIIGLIRTIRRGSRRDGTTREHE